MTYFRTFSDSIAFTQDDGTTVFLPPENNGTPEWRAYQEWLDEGNEPDPYIPPPPAPDYGAFWAALLASSVYGAIREQAMVSLPMNTLATEFIALLGDAKGGMAFPEAIQASMSAILAAGTFTPEHVAELQAALELAQLDGIYTLEAPAP